MKYSVNTQEFKSIKEMKTEEKPREKIKSLGASCLSDNELLCAMLGSGCNGISVNELAQRVLDYLAVNDCQEICFEELAGIKGMGNAQTALVCASVEFGRRMQLAVRPRCSTSNEVFEHIKHYGDRMQEHLICVMFNGALEVTDTRVITVGLVDNTQVHPREVFAQAIKTRASAIVIAHNHPSGNLKPSSQDLAVTQSMINAGKILGIRVMDHIIFSASGYYSINEHGDVWFD